MNTIYTRVLKASLVTFLGVLALAGNGAQAKTVKVALEGNYAPWNLTLPNGKISGFEPELLDNLCKRVNLQCETVAQDFDGLINGLQAGKFDVVMDALAITPERQQAIAFSKPYAATPAAFAALDGHGLANTTGKTPFLKLTGDPKIDGPMLAPLRSRARLMACLSASVMSPSGNASSADPPPEISARTRSSGASPHTLSRIAFAAAGPAASGTG